MSSLSLRGLLVALCLLASGAEARELRVCADPNNLPFSNGDLQGFENRIAALIAEEIGADLTYTWWAQRRGFLRNTLNAGRCDLVAGVPAGMEMLRTGAPYYRSTYVFVGRADVPPVRSFDDPALRELRIGVQLIGDDGWNTPPGHALASRGITGNVRGYMVYGDYSKPNPPAGIITAVAEGEIDVAVVWGPLGGFFASRQAAPPLTVTPVRPSLDGPLPMAFDISMGVRKDGEALLQEVEAALDRRRADVDAILAEYGVPRIDGPAGEAGAAQ